MAELLCVLGSANSGVATLTNLLRLVDLGVLVGFIGRVER